MSIYKKNSPIITPTRASLFTKPERETLAERAALQATLEAERIAAPRQTRCGRRSGGALTSSFKALSAEALQKNNESFLDLAKQTLATYQEGAKGDLDKRQQAIGELLAPMKTSLEKFEQQVQGVEKQRVETMKKNLLMLKI